MESVFQKLFPAKRRKPSKQFGFNFCRKSRQTSTVIELPSKDAEKERQEMAVVVSVPPPDVRLVLFRECGETSDRKLLFDSKSFEPEKPEPEEPQYFSTVSAQHGVLNNNSNKCQQRQTSGYQYVRGPQDSGILAEMLFGSVGMASRASSLKIHIIKEKGQLMLSRVFCVESAKETVSLERGMEHLRTPNPVLSRRKAKTLPVPTPEPQHVAATPTPLSLASSLTSRITRSDSSSSLMSLSSIFGSSLSNTGSLGSRSIPLQIPSVNTRAHSLPPATRQASRDSFTLKQEPHSAVMPRKTKVKIGFAVIFQPEPTNSSEFQRFFFEHFPLIESYVTCLKEQVESALNNNYRKRNTEFVQVMMEALHVFTLRVTSIYSSPRLPKPVWMTLTSVSAQKFPWLGDRITVECFIGDLTRMVAQNNTKHKNFFMSGLITSVLTHHLGWVNTALPPSGDNESMLLGYNPLWAQLGDIYGAVGTPTKVAKTVVTGEIHELVSTIISILSYFIRCSKIGEVVDVPSEVTPQVFLQEDGAHLKMSLVPSELENDYVYVSHDAEEETVEKPQEKTSDEKSKTKPLKPTKPEKSKRLSQFCRKLNAKLEPKTTEPIVCSNPPQETAVANGGTSLCRSRSSPGTAPKPLARINRQRSSGNVENLPVMRNRTNSNDMFGKPRCVQSRRTSYDVSNIRRMSQSSSALVIPDSEKGDFSMVSSLEGSKSLCVDQTPTYGTDLIRKRLGKENMGSCPGNRILKETLVKDSRPLVSYANKSRMETITSLNQKNSLSAPKTHKRVSSEPFRIEQLIISGGNGLTKTNSIYFDSKNAPVIKPTFVDAIEPKVVHATHVQRSQPVIAMASPRSSPYLPRSKSAVGQKGPIMGFKTSDKDLINAKPPTGSRMKKSLSKTSSTSSHDFKDVFSPATSEKSANSATSEKQNCKFEFGDAPEIHRSPSSASTGGIVRRTSSNTSGKTKLAGRRRKLTGDSTRSDASEDRPIERTSSEEIRNLPPLDRIPSVTLDHETFDEYLDENDENEENEVITFTASHHDRRTSTEQPSPARKTPQKDTVPPKSPKPSTTAPLVKAATPTTPKSPPPLPSVGPCHRSPSTKSDSTPTATTTPLAKVPPPLPAAPPIHRGPLYPSLDTDSDITPKNSPRTPQNSVYPSLDACMKSPCVHPPTPKIRTQLYPKLDAVTICEPDCEPKMYPFLPKINGAQVVGGDAGFAAGAVYPHEDENDDANFFTGREEVALTQVEYLEEEAQKPPTDEEDKPERLTFAELIADYAPEYLWGFALHGTRNHVGLYDNVVRELQHAISRPVLDEPVAEAVTIVADTDKWQVRVLSSHRIHSDNTALPALTSKLVTNILERITKLYQMRTPAAFCMQQLENELGELVLKSRMLAGYVVGNTRVTVSQLSAVLGIESNDLPLLMAIASCHSPQVAATLHSTL